MDNPFQINPDRLDNELVEMPSRLRDAGMREADARHALAQAKAKLDVTRARILLAVRKNPEDFHLRAKPNEAEVDATVTLHNDYQRDLEEVNHARKLLDLAEADTRAYEGMRQSVGRLVDLVQIAYYSERPVTSATEAGRERMRDSRSRGVEGGGYDPNE